MISHDAAGYARPDIKMQQKLQPRISTQHQGSTLADCHALNGRHP